MRQNGTMRRQVPLPLATFTALAALIPAVLLVGQLTLTGAQPVATSSRPVEMGHTPLANVPSAMAPIDAESPSPEPTWEPAPGVAPAPNDVLALAGRNGVPGFLHCGADFSFRLDVLNGPAGAERLLGPEYDSLRDFVGGDGFDSPSREVTRSPSKVAFLIERNDAGPWGENGGPYRYLYYRKVDGDWNWAGNGDCQPRAYAPPGYGAATWTLDPDFRRPRPADRVLHLLVSEFECSSGRSATGRIGPAYVITDRYEVHIELLVQWLPGGQDCQAAPPTQATLRLPEPLGDRSVRDTNAHIRSGSGG